MAAFFAGLFALITGLLVEFLVGIAFVGAMCVGSQSFRDMVVGICGKANDEDWDNI